MVDLICGLTWIWWWFSVELICMVALFCCYVGVVLVVGLAVAVLL